MNSYDLDQFQQAIKLAQSGQKNLAYTRIKILLQANPAEVNLWLWLIFTTPDLAEAEQALDRVRLLDPHNPGLISASNWLHSEIQKLNQSKKVFEEMPPPQWSTSQPTIVTANAALPQNNIFRPPVTLLNQLSFRQWLFVLGTTLLGSAILGILIGIISQLYYLVIVLPLFLGVVGAYLIRWIMRRAGVENPKMEIGLVVLLSFTIYSCFLFTNYQYFKADLYKEIVNLSDNQIDSALQRQVGSTGFMGFLQLVSKQGIPIGMVSSPTSNVKANLKNNPKLILKDGAVWGSWLFEILIIALTAQWQLSKTLSRNYCNYCHQPYSRWQMPGKISQNLSARFLNLMAAQDFRQAGQLLGREKVSGSKLILELERCKKCNREVQVAVNRVALPLLDTFIPQPVFSARLTPRQYAELVASQQSR